MPDARSGSPSETRNKRSSLSFGTLWRGLRRHPIVLFLVVIASASAAAAIWFFLPLPKMAAYSTIQISSQPQALIAPVGDTKADFMVYRQAQAALIKSRPVLNAALNQPGMTENPLLAREIGKFGWLEAKLKVDFRSAPEFMRLSLEGDDGDNMKAVIDAVTNAYLKQVVERDSVARNRRMIKANELSREYALKLDGFRGEKQQLAQIEAMAARVNQELECLRVESETPSRIRLLEEPAIMLGDEGNRRVKYSVLAGLAVLLLGVGLVIFLDARNRRLQTADEFRTRSWLLALVLAGLVLAGLVAAGSLGLFSHRNSPAQVVAQPPSRLVKRAARPAKWPDAVQQSAHEHLDMLASGFKLLMPIAGRHRSERMRWAIEKTEKALKEGKEHIECGDKLMASNPGEAYREFSKARDAMKSHELDEIRTIITDRPPSRPPGIDPGIVWIPFPPARGR